MAWDFSFDIAIAGVGKKTKLFSLPTRFLTKGLKHRYLFFGLCKI